jgi:hypothetical protein
MRILRVLIELFDRSHSQKEREMIVKLIKEHMESEIDNGK